MLARPQALSTSWQTASGERWAPKIQMTSNLISLINTFYLSVSEPRLFKITNYPVALDSKYYVIFNCTASVMPPIVFLT